MDLRFPDNVFTLIANRRYSWHATWFGFPDTEAIIISENNARPTEKDMFHNNINNSKFDRKESSLLFLQHFS
jgi:hypothetical protein